MLPAAWFCGRPAKLNGLVTRDVELDETFGKEAGEHGGGDSNSDHHYRTKQCKRR